MAAPAPYPCIQTIGTEFSDPPIILCMNFDRSIGSIGVFNISRLVLVIIYLMEI